MSTKKHNERQKHGRQDGRYEKDLIFAQPAKRKKENIRNFGLKFNSLIMKTLPMTTILFLALSIFLNTGCKKDNEFPCDCTNNTLHINIELHHKWSFKSFETLSGKKDVLPSDLKKMHIEFNDTTLSVNGQNNTCGGNYETYENNCLNIMNLSCTEVGGTKEQLEWESRYFIGLNQVECYEIKDGKLKLYYHENGKEKIMNFEK